jgi:hypothetical protein
MHYCCHFFKDMNNKKKEKERSIVNKAECYFLLVDFFHKVWIILLLDFASNTRQDMRNRFFIV